MKKDIEEQVIAEANYILSTNATVREAAIHFGLSKSTIHSDITYRLEKNKSITI